MGLVWGMLLLAGGFLEENRARLGLRGLRLASDAQAALQRQPWPGNVRELEHLISRAAVRAVAREQPSSTRIVTLHASHLDLAPTVIPPVPAPPTDTQARKLTLREAVDVFKYTMVADTLAHHGGNRAAAARELGLDPANLHRLLKRLDGGVPEGLAASGNPLRPVAFPDASGTRQTHR